MWAARATKDKENSEGSWWGPGRQREPQEGGEKSRGLGEGSLKGAGWEEQECSGQRNSRCKGGKTEHEVQV